GVLNLAQENYAQAEQKFQRVLAIQEKSFGAGHFNTAQVIQYLAQAQRLKGDLPQSIALMTRSNEISERFLSRNLSGGSERQKQALLTAVLPQVANSIVLHAVSAPNNPDALKLALTMVLRRKGRGLDVMTDAIAQLRRRAKPEDQKLLDELAAAQSQLAAFTLKEPDQAAPDAYRAQLKQLTDQVEKLETDISARNAEFRVQSQPVTIAAVQAAIPEGMALVEFARYEPQNLKTLGTDPARYAVYVLTKQGEPRWADLGEAAPIEQAVGELRKALQNPKRKDVKALSRKLDELVMRPVRPLLGTTRKVFISPDGALNLIPFAALADERGKYLVSNFTFNYLTSGRDLLRLQLHQPGKQTTVIFANPNFGELQAGKSDSRLLVTKQANPQTTTVGFDFSRAYFSPLPGTAGEARALKRLLPQAEVLTQAQASEAALKQLHSPKVLHVATHGFFLQNLDSITEGTRRLKHLGLAPATSSNSPTGAVNLRSDNPLLRSGLAFSGANLHKKGDDDGILTALEASGLDLWGTKLVVLSACDTGVGEVKNGEGVYGLRRALVLAGSETQGMSL
ncbi:MAG: CHAT domain-containing tetratricopeptide repeat protein, partial [Acidobacteriota bacterium]